jgi:hypothetical protein
MTAKPLQPDAWMVIGAEARRPFVFKEDADAYAGEWGIVKPLFLNPPSPPEGIELETTEQERTQLACVRAENRYTVVDPELLLRLLRDFDRLSLTRGEQP